MRYIIILLCSVLCSVRLGAQEGITNPLSTSETFRKTATADTTRTILFPSPSLYSRSIPSFLFGVNWGTFGNRAINETMGQRFVDDHYVEKPENLAVYPNNTRIVVGLHEYSNQGHLSISLTSAFSSRADPELMLDTTTFWSDPRWAYAAIRSGDKSGATRGFVTVMQALLCVTRWYDVCRIRSRRCQQRSCQGIPMHV